MALKGDILYFYNDVEFKSIYIAIEWNDILCVNKHQIDRFDLRTFSIHYKKGKCIYEIRLKCVSRSEVDEWIERFQEKGISRHDFKIELTIDKLLTSFRKKPELYYTGLNKIVSAIHDNINKDVFDMLKENSIAQKYVNEYLHNSDINVNVNDSNDKSNTEVPHNENIPFMNKIDTSKLTETNKDNSILRKGKIKVMDFAKNNLSH
jgi:hypothetical protein